VAGLTISIYKRKDFPVSFIYLLFINVVLSTSEYKTSSDKKFN
jgi:hypothetical protein